MKIGKSLYIFPFLLLFIQPIFMASNLIVARGAVEYVPPISLAFWRWLTVFLILIPFNYKLIIKNILILKKEYKKIFFLGSMGCGICGVFPFMAGQSTTVTNMGIIYTSSPIFIIILSTFFFNENFSLHKLIGLVFCLLGVLIIIIKGDLSLLINLEFTYGDLWMLGAAIGWAFYSIFLLNWKSEFNLFARFTLIALFGSISILPFYLIEEFFLFNNTEFHQNFFLWVSFAAISPSIIAFSLYAVLQKYLGVSVTSLTLYLFTVYGAVYGLILFNEKLEFFHYLGTIFVFLGIYLVKKKISNVKFK